MRVLGLDYGKKHIGLALSDPEGRLAWPHGVMMNSPAVLDRLKKLCLEERVDLIVIGEPLRLNRQPNPIFKSTQQFADRLHQLTKLPIIWEPEWFTTTEARRLSAHHDAGRLDATAAALILRTYLERQRNNFSSHV